MHGGKRKGAGRPKGRGPHGEPTQAIRLPVSAIHSVMKLITSKTYQLPLYESKVSAGFPSPAEDYLEDTFDLNEHLIKHPAATFLVRATGDSMINVGIFEGDILVVDRSIPPTPGRVVIAAIDGQLTVKRLQQHANGEKILAPENPKYEPILIKENNDVIIWGVVTNVIHAL